jgi:hypothetical protein
MSYKKEDLLYYISNHKDGECVLTMQNRNDNINDIVKYIRLLSREVEGLAR